MSAARTDIYLASYLEPLAPFLAREDITDIFVNRPGELWIEALGGTIERVEREALSEQALLRLARQIAALSAQGISREHPLLAATLPDGSRIQIALPPATRGNIAMAIRKHVSSGLSLEDYEDAGAFEAVRRRSDECGQSAFEMADGANPKHVLRRAVQDRKNILISGGTSTGKTTFLNALLNEVPRSERLILIEDTPELKLVHDNAIGLLAARGSMSEAAITAEDLLIASLRMRPDRIILGEMRGSEAMTFLRAINTGHPGSLSTIHADSPERAIDQIALLVLQSGSRLAWENVVQYVTRSIDVIVQLRREGGRRRVDAVICP